MATHFSQLFWGLLLVTLDFNINGFDVLVDGVGFLIVAAGCGGLSSLSPRFETTRTLCVVMALLWLIGLAVHGDIAVPFSLARMTVNCAMFWQLLGGLGEFALSRERSDLADRAGNLRLVYVVMMIGSSLFVLAMTDSRIIDSQNAGTFAMALIVSMLILMATILHLIHCVKVELAT
jgi:hypothetical protein